MFSVALLQSEVQVNDTWLDYFIIAVYFVFVLGIGYVLAVTLTLASNRTWHIMAVAALGAFLLMLAPLVSPYDTTWWRYLENHAVTLFAIVVTSVYGSANMRKRFDARKACSVVSTSASVTIPRPQKASPSQ